MPLPAARKSVDKSKNEAPEGINVARPRKGEKNYDTAQAAEYLNCTPGHVRKLLSDGKLEAREKVGKHRTFTQAALDAYKRVRRSVGRPIGSGTITRDEEERRWWREYMRDRRSGKKGSKAAGKKSRKALAGAGRSASSSKKAVAAKGAAGKRAAGRKKKPATKSPKR